MSVLPDHPEILYGPSERAPHRDEWREEPSAAPRLANDSGASTRCAPDRTRHRYSAGGACKFCPATDPRKPRPRGSLTDSRKAQPITPAEPPASEAAQAVTAPEAGPGLVAPAAGASTPPPPEPSAPAPLQPTGAAALPPVGVVSALPEAAPTIPLPADPYIAAMACMAEGHACERREEVARLAGIVAPISRRSYLGSADIPMVVGVSTFGGPWHVWASKCEDLPEDESEHLRIGLELEEGIARLWAWKNGATLIGKGSLVLHPDDPRTGATVDYWARLADGRVGLVECKNVGPGGRANWSDDDGDALPQGVIAQTTWQMGHALAAGERCDFIAVAKLEFGCRIKSAWVDFDPEMFDLLLAEGRAFWTRHVETNTPPPLDGSEAATAHLGRRWPKNNGTWLPATDERKALVRALKDAKAATKDAERAEEEAKQRVLVAIGEADGIDGLAKWSAEAGRASWKDIAEAVAKGAALDKELIGAHTSKGSRTLRLLGGK